jgi:uncharacterized protein YkwD
MRLPPVRSEVVPWPRTGPDFDDEVEPAALTATPPTSSRPPRRVLARALGLAGTTLAAAALLAWSPQQVTGWNRSAAEATVWQLLNGARVNNGRSPLQQHGTLVSLARWRSQDMVDRNYFSHDVLGTGYQVYHWYDLNGLSYSWGGENIGWNNGYSDADSPVAIHEGFMNSPGHRANILEPSFTHGGVGAYAADNVPFLGKIRSPRFYTELFMAAAASAPPPPPPSDPNPSSPPSTGSGGGGSAQPAAQPVAKARPQAKRLRVDRPAAPVASLAGRERILVDGVERVPPTLASADGANEDAASITADTVSYRVESAAAPDRGVFETLLGTVLGFFI